jgi:hypothetical protein
MSTIVKYSSGSTYTLVKQKVDTEIIQDVTTYHVPLTNINGGVRGGLGLSRITIAGQIEDRTACLWHDIVAVSLDSGTSYQTVYFSSVSFGDDGWSSIYSYTLSLLVSPLREGATTRYPTTGYQWGQSTLANVHHHGGTGVAANVELNYLAPLFYFPLASSIVDFAGRSLTFTRTLAKAHGGISYLANIPIYNNGLVLSSETSQDVAKWTPAASTLKTIACQIKQTAYPKNWVIGAGAGTANLLTANQSNAETDTTGMTSAGGTLTRNTGTPLAGTADFKLVSTGSNDLILKTTTTAVAVTAGQWYCAQALCKVTAAAGRHIKIGISWYTAADALVSTDYGAEQDVPTTATVISVVLEAPATATKAYVWIDVVSSLNAEILYADSLMLEALPTSVTVWTAALNKLTISLAADTLSWTDDTTTVSATFPTADYMDGHVVDLVCVDDTSHAVVVAAHPSGGAWTHADGTLAAIAYPELTLGNLEGSLAHLVEYPYALVAAEYEAIVFSPAPLKFNSMCVANRNAVTIQRTTDHTLLFADGTDVSGLLGGTPLTVTTVNADIACSAGLTARWYVQVKDTNLT